MRRGSTTRVYLISLGIGVILFEPISVQGEPQSPPSAQTASPKMTKGMATLLNRLQSDANFVECVYDGLAARKISNAGLAVLVAKRGLSGELFATVTAEIHDPERWLAGFVSVTTDPDETLAAKAIFIVDALAKNHNSGDEPGAERAADGFFLVVNRALDNVCPAPTQGGIPTAAQVEAVAPMIAEATRVKTCAVAEMERRHLSEAGALALLDLQPDKATLLARVLELISSHTDVDADKRAKLAQDAKIAPAVETFLLASSMTMNLPVMARGEGIESVYLDRALRAGCKPTSELLQFLGTPSYAY